MSADWNTKYGTRRVRHDPPTLEEAIFAAVGITDDQEAQAEIAASLMGLPLDVVQAEVKKFLVTIPQYPFQQGTSLNAAGINYQTLKAADALKRLQELETLGYPKN